MSDPFFHFCMECDRELFYVHFEDPDLLPAGVAARGHWTTRPDTTDLIYLTCEDGRVHQRGMILENSIYAHLEMIVEELSAA